MSVRKTATDPQTVYRPKLAEQLNNPGYYANGVVSIASMILFCQPGFVAKTFATKGWSYTPLEIIKNREWIRLGEGTKIAYRGWFNHAVGGFSIQGLAFVVQGMLTDWLSDRGKRQLNPLEKLFTSSGAALFASPVNTAFELTYVRAHVTGNNLTTVAKEIFTQGGLLGFKRGWRGTTMRAMVYISSLFGVNDGCQWFTNAFFPNSLPHKKRFADITGSALAGSLAGAITGPIDMIKTAMQADYKAEKYFGVFQTGRILVKEKGWGAVWKVTKIRSGLIAGVVVVVATAKDSFPFVFKNMGLNFLFKEEYRD